jgi:ubiquinone/menaquinone biosynthesis C-methylase UbiE
MDRKNPDWQEDRYSTDKIRAVDAKYEAQKIAFAPLVFQAALSLRELGVLSLLLEAGDTGITSEVLREKLEISEYALNVLLEMGLSMDIVKWEKDSSPRVYTLGKVGFFLETDSMTKANMDFSQDVCYHGAFHMLDALKSGKPEGLQVFGGWDTIYEGLSSLPEKVQDSWFAFDHYYSDGAFPKALDFVFKKEPQNLMDIGGNTAKWAFACAGYNPRVNVTIVDLPGQAGMARKRIETAGLSDRISLFEGNVLREETVLPTHCDAVWMSQFLDCFSLDEITSILKKVYNAVDEKAQVFVMEPLWDRQKYPAASYSLHATSLYFTAMANGNSKMYGYDELVRAVEAGGFVISDEIHELGPNDYSILKFSKKAL